MATPLLVAALALTPGPRPTSSLLLLRPTASPAAPRRSRRPVALFGPPDRLEFSDDFDAKRATSFIRSFPSKFRGWGESEWRTFGLPALSFSTKPIDGGVSLVYYLTEAQARAKGKGGLVEDGGLELTAQAGGAGGLFASAPGIVVKARRGSVDRSRQEEVLVARLADECRSTRASNLGSYRGWKPPQGTVGKLNAIAGACLYAKAVSKRY